MWAKLSVSLRGEGGTERKKTFFFPFLLSTVFFISFREIYDSAHSTMNVFLFLLCLDKGMIWCWVMRKGNVRRSFYVHFSL